MAENTSTLGKPRRYLCSATYVTGSDRRYLIRELKTPITGEELRQTVVDLFVSDLMQPRRTAKTAGQAEEKMKEMKMVYMPGKLTDLTIEELKDTKIPIKKPAD